VLGNFSFDGKSFFWDFLKKMHLSSLNSVAGSMSIRETFCIQVSGTPEAGPQRQICTDNK